MNQFGTLSTYITKHELQILNDNLVLFLFPLSWSFGGRVHGCWTATRWCFESTGETSNERSQNTFQMLLLCLDLFPTTPVHVQSRHMSNVFNWCPSYSCYSFLCESRVVHMIPGYPRPVHPPRSLPAEQHLERNIPSLLFGCPLTFPCRYPHKVSRTNCLYNSHIRIQSLSHSSYTERQKQQITRTQFFFLTCFVPVKGSMC